MTLTVDQLGRICHEANRALCEVLGEGDQPPWARAPKSSHEATVDSIKAIRGGEVKTPEQLHQRWIDTKLKAGWTYGPRKDLVAKTHPLLVPFKDLSPGDQAKDVLFLAIVRKLG